MIWWWVGDAVLLFGVIPLVLFLLNRVLRPAREIGKYTADILDHGVAGQAAVRRSRLRIRRTPAARHPER